MKSLPNQPNLTFLSREAKRLKSHHRAGDTTACRSIGHFDTSLHGLSDQQILETRFSILDAQRVVARQYGFASWNRLSRFIKLAQAGSKPTDSHLAQLIHHRHKALAALQDDLKNKKGDYKKKYKEYRNLSLDSPQFLNTALDTHGWPGPDVVGFDCMEPLWFVAANAVYDANFQKRALDAVSEALPNGGFWEYHYAALKDRYLTLSKQATVYGVSFGCYYDDDGTFQLHYTDVINPVNLDKRRATAGYESRATEYTHHLKEAEEHQWELGSLQQVKNELDQLAVDGGYLNP